MQLPAIKSNPIFFEVLDFFNRLSRVKLNFSSLDKVLLNEDYTPSHPAEILEILVALFAFSQTMPETTITVGIGDIAVFWAEFVFKNGVLVNQKALDDKGSYDFEEILDPENLKEENAFVCSREEVKDFFESSSL